MFKTLIKKVRKESSNPSILSENNIEETNGHLSKENQNSFEEINSSATRIHQRSNSSTSENRHNSNESDKKEESIKSLADIFSPYVHESISIDNYVQILKSWIDSKEAVLEEKDDVMQRSIQQIKDLEKEITELRIKLVDFQVDRTLKEKSPTENVTKVPHLQKQIDTLRSENDNLKTDMKSLRKQLNDVETERDDLLIKSTDVKPTDDFQRQLLKQKAENEQQKIELDKLRQALLERDAIIEEQDKRLLVDHETQAIQTDEDKSFVQVFAEPDVDTISKLQAELDEKNRAIKTLQQRYNDLRKTLQREFHASIPKDLNQMSSSKTYSNTPASPTNLPLIHYDATATSQNDVDAAKRAPAARQTTGVRKNVTFTSVPAETSPAILPHTSIESKPQRNGHRPSVEGSGANNGTNFKYLKHVLLKFMTSTEEEAIHLIRAVSTLLNFSVDEERLLRETLDYKMSWFGKVSRLKPVSTNTNF